jgi:hypothetical protein
MSGFYSIILYGLIFSAFVSLEIEAPLNLLILWAVISDESVGLKEAAIA